VCVLAQRQAVARVVVPGTGERVDVGRIHDAAGVDGQQPVSRECAGVVVRGDDVEPEPGLAAPAQGSGRLARIGRMSVVIESCIIVPSERPHRAAVAMRKSQEPTSKITLIG
jgi:hypothetical protein